MKKKNYYIYGKRVKKTYKFMIIVESKLKNEKIIIKDLDSRSLIVEDNIKLYEN
jgi:hypothetical protein